MSAFVGSVEFKEPRMTGIETCIGIALPSKEQSMEVKMSKDRILLIDGDRDCLQKLSSQLQQVPCMVNVEIVLWTPTCKEEKNPTLEFYSIIEENRPVLVVTEYDLTSNGYNGLFGPTITHWCHKELIPVIEFSRECNEYLPQYPNLFNLRAPESENELPNYIAALTEGFLKLKKLVRNRNDISMSYSVQLCEILGRNNCSHNELTDYFSHFFSNIDFLYESTILQQGEEYNSEKIRRILTYVFGHVIVNSMLRFPGPIVSSRALCAYLAVDYSELGKLQKIFEFAKYDGPFDMVNEFFWKLKIDDKIEEFIESHLENKNFEEQNRNKGIVELSRSAIEFETGDLTRHKCKNGCKGVKGGFFCPFTLETVCKSLDCSVSSSSWIPHGANICRVEKNFYERWTPLLTK